MGTDKLTAKVAKDEKYNEWLLRLDEPGGYEYRGQIFFIRSGSLSLNRFIDDVKEFLSTIYREYMLVDEYNRPLNGA